MVRQRPNVTEKKQSAASQILPGEVERRRSMPVFREMARKSCSPSKKIFSYTLELHLMIKMYKTPKRSFPTVECCVLQSWTLLVTIGSWCDDDVNIANEVVNLPLVNSGNRRDRGHRRHGPGRGWRHSQASYWGVRRQAAGQDRFWWANECLNRIGRLRTK